MDGKRFDALIRRLSTARLTRLRALQGVAAATAVGLTGSTLATEGAEAADRDRRDRTRTICHCADTDPEQLNCVTKRLPVKRARRHLRRHAFDFPGKCVTTRVACSAACVPGREVCCPPGSTQSGTCQKSRKACNKE
jgi:hypothetical protein